MSLIVRQNDRRPSAKQHKGVSHAAFSMAQFDAVTRRVCCSDGRLYRGRANAGSDDGPGCSQTNHAARRGGPGIAGRVARASRGRRLARGITRRVAGSGQASRVAGSVTRRFARAIAKPRCRCCSSRRRGADKPGRGLSAHGRLPDQLVARA
jgi:hypothetical protein